MLTVDYIITHMRMLYGERFNSQWKTVPPEEMRRVWGHYVQGYTQEELKRGLNELMNHPFPPTMPQFFMLCRPRLNADSAFVEALNGLQARQCGKMGKWSHPAVFWAASTMAFDLLNRPYSLIREQWKVAYEESLNAGRWEPIPEVAPALPAPAADSHQESESVTRCRITLGKMVRQILQCTDRDPTYWITHNFERMLAGEKIDFAAREITLKTAKKMHIPIPEGLSA